MLCFVSVLFGIQLATMNAVVGVCICHAILEPWHFITSAHQLSQDIEQPAADIREKVRSSHVHIVVHKDNTKPKVVPTLDT